jgi:uncharacterized membrane protein
VKNFLYFLFFVKTFEGSNLKPLKWFEIIVGFTVLTLLVTYLIPSDSWLEAIRVVFTFIFVAFLPGYCLVNLLFIGKNKIDFVETLVLSVALSFGLAGLDGLFLGLSPIGIASTPIAASLSILTLVLATMAFARKSREKLPYVKVPEQVSA